MRASELQSELMLGCGSLAGGFGFVPQGRVSQGQLRMELGDVWPQRQCLLKVWNGLLLLHAHEGVGDGGAGGRWFRGYVNHSHATGFIVVGELFHRANGLRVASQPARIFRVAAAHPPIRPREGGDSNRGRRDSNSLALRHPRPLSLPNAAARP